MGSIKKDDGKYEAIGSIKIDGEMIDDGDRFNCSDSTFKRLKATGSAKVYGENGVSSSATDGDKEAADGEIAAPKKKAKK